MCPQYQYYLIMLTQKPICKKQSPSFNEAWKGWKDFGEENWDGLCLQPHNKAELRRAPEISGHGWIWIKSTCSTRSILYAGKGRSGLRLEFQLSQGEVWPGTQLESTSPATWTQAQTATTLVGIFGPFPFPLLSCASSWFSSLGSSLHQKSHADLGDVDMLHHYVWKRKNLQPPAPKFQTRLQLTLAPPQGTRLFLSVHEIVLHVEVQDIPFLSPLT